MVNSPCRTVRIDRSTLLAIRAARVALINRSSQDDFALKVRVDGAARLGMGRDDDPVTLRELVGPLSRFIPQKAASCVHFVAEVVDGGRQGCSIQAVSAVVAADGVSSLEWEVCVYLQLPNERDSLVSEALTTGTGQGIRSWMGEGVRAEQSQRAQEHCERLHVGESRLESILRNLGAELDAETDFIAGDAWRYHTRHFVPSPSKAN